MSKKDVPIAELYIKKHVWRELSVEPKSGILHPGRTLNETVNCVSAHCGRYRVA